MSSPPRTSTLWPICRTEELFLRDLRKRLPLEVTGLLRDFCQWSQTPSASALSAMIHDEEPWLPAAVEIAYREYMWAHARKSPLQKFIKQRDEVGFRCGCGGDDCLECHLRYLRRSIDLEGTRTECQEDVAVSWVYIVDRLWLEYQER